MNNVAIIVGAGKGKRIGLKDKAFLIINRETLLVHAISPFEKCGSIKEIILVVRKNRINSARRLINKCQFKKVKKIITGGKTRQDSVYNALQKIEEADYVLIHDAARPAVTEQLIENCLENAQKFGAAVPAIPPRDTVKQGSKFVQKTLPRNNLWLAQTPQAFRYEILKGAHESARKNNFYGTDDASLVERMGRKIKIVPGLYENIKITTPVDINIGKRLLGGSFPRQIEIKACAKINLSFEIIDKLSNGYHAIRSIFQAINLYDVIYIAKKDREYNLTGAIVCPSEKNLITKAKKALEEYVQKALPCTISLTKNIPISAGLGGGSSDAAAALIGLNKLYNLKLTKKELMKIGLSIGCDVPFFVANYGTALIEGVGEKIKPIKQKVSRFYVLMRPHQRISTAYMYQLYDRTGKQFSELIQKACPATKKICSHFSKYSGECGLSGSGPTIFAGFNSYDKATKTIESFGPENFDGDIFICRPIKKTYKSLV
ncbi:2-C-methyl-D-erythritol 4-phosphate cytidylyltransferase [Candidatus Falkowbacteria bacterium]|nr:2-C-methyl-D-erythritol 4-phosphate cytidylyltransferase [Candidatus Falkowbacteria bacterium]